MWVEHYAVENQTILHITQHFYTAWGCRVNILNFIVQNAAKTLLNLILFYILSCYIKEQ